ncbi:MAG TPA: HEAT repeat domain-containing protein [Anaeromyxobacter sp.]|nr:HEAT repeat domain-containing protein [Anaeromyxobacter sp.]
MGVGEAAVAVDPEGILRSALEKIVFFECRVSQLESELAAARTTAERARAEAIDARRRETELAQALAAERGAHGDAEARADDLGERVRLLEGERERLLSGLVERARVGGAPGGDGAPGPEEGGADLAGFIAELRGEIQALRAWKAAAEAAGIRGPADAVPAARGGRAAESVPALAERFRAEGRVGLSGRDADRLKDLLPTRADRVLYERSMDDLAAPDARVRARAVRALEALGARAAAPLLAAAVGREADETVKAAILGALGRFQEPFAADLCTRALEDARPAVRVAALEALARVASGDAEPRIAQALADPSPLVRRRAALLLGFTGGDRAEAALSVALGDPDRGVARAAAAALSGRPTARAQGALARALEHPDENVRRAAAASLARVAGEPVSAEGPAPELRATSRRIAARLAAMDGAELREAVLAGANAAGPAAPVVARPSTSSGRADTRPPLGLRISTAVAARPSTSSGRADARPATVARAAAAVMVQEAVPQPAAPGLEAAILSEVRMALRGVAPADLAAAVGATPDAVAAALETLRARGTLVQRGSRWFTA